MKMIVVVSAIVSMIAVAACSNSSVQTNEEGIVSAETSGSILRYSMDDVIKLTLKNANKHCLEKETRANTGTIDGEEIAFEIKVNIDDLKGELTKLKDVLETGKGIFDIFPSHIYKVTGTCK